MQENCRLWYVNVFILRQVGVIVCRVKATDHDGDEVDFSIDPSPSAGFPGFPFKDGSPYFRINKRGSEGIVSLSASLLNEFKVKIRIIESILMKCPTGCHVYSLGHNSCTSDFEKHLFTLFIPFRNLLIFEIFFPQFL